MLHELRNAELIGIDCETQDEDRHPGLNVYNNEKRHVFDHRRTVMTGFSLHVDGSPNSWYINLAHADTENCIAMGQALMIVDAINPMAIKVAHNASFEYMMFQQCLGVIFDNLVCTLQLAVTHHGPDEYPFDKFFAEPLKGFLPIARDARRAFHDYDPETRGQSLTPQQAEVLGQFIAKESKARHSYNGYVKSINYGYGLKQLVMSIFGYQMATFKETLAQAGAKHMGQLTGAQVCAYGADDAYWAVRLYKWLVDDLMRTNPAALVTFLETENPMVRVFADVQIGGLRLDLEQVFERQQFERAHTAQVLRDLKAAMRVLLPFPEGPNEKLLEIEGWYAKSWEKKRQQIIDWLASPDSEDDFEQCFQVSNPIGNAWAIQQEIKIPKEKLNLGHFHGMRTILYDLMGHRVIRYDGKVQSDAAARGTMSRTFEKEGKEDHLKVLKLLQELAEIEQRMKLYITPYSHLMDPETGRVYPTLSSKLATRRMAMSDPNGMQLAKRGSSTYIRGFYLGDDDDHLIVSADWSSVELVIIGDQSDDPGFRKVFGQLPYGDLHSGAAADCIAVKTIPGLTEDEFNLFKRGENPNGRVLRNFTTDEVMDPKKFHKLARTAVGKGANFNYFFSGSLSTIGGVLGWTSDEMWAAVERYRNRFAKAEEWRVRQQRLVAEQGYVELPDHHRRVRFEATQHWASAMRMKFAQIDATSGMLKFADLAIKRIQSRAKNQAVNAMIQGTCATLAKRSILRIRQLVEEAGLSHLVRFMMPIHDELVFSVHRSVIMEFIPLLRRGMCEHPQIVTRLPLDCTVAIGRSFKPFDGTPFSQWELDEAEPFEGVIPVELQGQKLDNEHIEKVVSFMFDKSRQVSLINA